MRKLLDPIKEISDLRNAAIMFSCGRDSAVMLDLFSTYAREAIGSIVFMYYCPGLAYEERILDYYERRYKLKIERIAHPDCAYLVNSRAKGRKVRVSDVEKRLRQEYEVEWVAWGYRKDESLQRRGQLTMAPNGIDWKYRKLFPLSEWSRKHTAAWVVKRKLLLPPEYKHNLRDLNTFKGESLLYIYRNYPDDYHRIITMYPDVQGELMRALDGIGGKSK